MIRRYVDTLAFMAPPAKPPIIEGDWLKDFLVTHVTTAPPFVRTRTEIINAHHAFVGQLERQGIKLVRRADDLGDDSKLVIAGLQNLPADADVMVFKSLGLRVFCLAYDQANRFGHGFACPEGGLTPDGAEFIRLCHREQLIVDLSHANHQTARDVLDLISREHLEGIGLMASHGGCHAIFPHPRNLPDDVLRRIAQLGGIVGIAALTFILSDVDDTLKPFMRHLGHAVDICGRTQVAIGTDHPYCGRPIDQWQAEMAVLATQLNVTGAFNPRWPDQPLDLNTPDKMRILDGLISDHFSPEASTGILGVNAHAFFLKHLPKY